MAPDFDTESMNEKFHLVIALFSNFIVLASAPHTLQIFYGDDQKLIFMFISLAATYFYFAYRKTIQIFDFEQIYVKNCGILKSELEKLKNEKSKQYFKQIIAYFEKNYSGVQFEFKIIENDFENGKSYFNWIFNLKNCFKSCLKNEKYENLVKAVKD